MSGAQPKGSPASPPLVGYVRVDPADGRLQPLHEQSGVGRRPPPTAPSPAPPELIPDESEALAVCLSPDVCRSPKRPVPYMAWGKADDKQNYSPDVRANGRVIKRQDSKFSCCYGDEPGVGKGVKSGTVGDVVEPVTSSAIVRANGIPVQRHADRCTLNSGNCPGEYVHVKSTDVTAAPDGADQGDRAWYRRSWDGFFENSEEAQFADGVIDKAGQYWADPSTIGTDIQSVWQARPGVDDIVSYGENVGRGIANTAGYVWNNPGQSAENVANWTGDTLNGLWTGVSDAYGEGGVAQAGGYLTATAVGVINPFKKAKAAGEAVDVLEDVAKAKKRLEEAKEAARKAKAGEEKAEQDSKDGTRSTRLIPFKEVECFNKPQNVDKDEFLRQLKEQEDALNSTSAETLLARRQAIRDAGGTSPLRDARAQANARLKYTADRFDALRTSGKTRAEARSILDDELSKLAATHRLDIIAGGDPTDISGMGNTTANSSMGSQWKGRRSQSVEDYARDLEKNGAAKQKMRVKLRMC